MKLIILDAGIAGVSTTWYLASEGHDVTVIDDMADNKAYLESIARSFGYFFGKDKKVRVNTISQSPTATTAG